MELREWTKHYIKFQDCMKKQILSLTETPEGYDVKEKKEEKTYLVQEQLQLPASMQHKTFIITTNTKENLTHLKKEWTRIQDAQELTIYFVNPKTNEKWHVQPYYHAKITADIPKSLDILFNSITEL